MIRPSLRRLAENVSVKPLNVQQVNDALLPPKPLFRALLRAHRTLPVEMRSLGDNYLKAEFRRHQQTTNPVHVIGFLSQWKRYLDELPGTNFRGKKLDPTVFEKMSAEQLGQLYELMQATKEIYNEGANGDKSTS